MNAFKENFIKLIKNNNIFYCAANLKIIIKLADENIIIFINTGFKINIINERETDSRDLIIIKIFILK